MAISTVELNGETIMTVNDTTADASEVLSGQYFYEADGDKVQGTIPVKSSSDLTASGATVTVPAGYYASQVTKSPIPTFTVTFSHVVTCNMTYAECAALLNDSMGYIPNTAAAVCFDDGYGDQYVTFDSAWLDWDGSAYAYYCGAQIAGEVYDIQYWSNGTIELISPSLVFGEEGTPVATKGAVSNHSIAVTPSVTNIGGYITGGTKIGTAVTVSASELASGTLSISSSGSAIDVTNYSAVNVPAGSAFTPAVTITANPIFSLNSSTGVVTATAAGSSSITPTVNAGYISSGTAGTVSVSGTSTYALSTQAAQTITPTTTNQTISAGRYLTGAQTILGDANLLSSNIASGVSIFGVNGTFEGGSASVVSAQYIPDYYDREFDISNGAPFLKVLKGMASKFTGANNYLEISGTPKLLNNFITNGTYHIKGVFKRISAGKSYSIDSDFTFSTLNSTSVTWVEDGTENTVLMGFANSTSNYNCRFYLSSSDIANDISNTSTGVDVWADFIVTYKDAYDGFNEIKLVAGPSPFMRVLNRGYTGVFSYDSYIGLSSEAAAYSIGTRAFAASPLLTQVYFSTISVVGENAFYSCTKLNSINFKNASLFNNYAFQACPNLINVSAPELITVGAYCFTYCSKLPSIYLPKVTSIGMFAFSSCWLLENVSFPSLINIGGSAFAFCSKLSTFDLKNISKVDPSTFYSCIELLNVINTSGLSSIGSQAFNYCKKLSTFSADNVTIIHSSAFANCDLLSRVDFSNALTLSAAVFQSCSNLQHVNIPNLTTIGAGAFSNCSLLLGVSFSKVVSAGTAMFSKCETLSYAYFSLLEYLPSSAFDNCYSLSDVSVPLVRAVSSYAFRSCWSLSTLILPAVSTISGSAFASCYNLLSLYILSNAVCGLTATTTFASTPISNYTTSTGGVYGSIYVPASLLASYKAATNWKTYSARMVGLTDAQISAILG